MRRVRGLAPGSGSLIFARALSRFSAAAFESRASRGPNSLSLRLFFIGVPCDCLVERMLPSEWRATHRDDRMSKSRRVSESDARTSPAGAQWQCRASCLLFVLSRNALFLNGDQNEKKKRDPRFLEEEEGASAAFGDRPNQAAATSPTPRSSGESRKATRHVDEIRTSRVVNQSYGATTTAPRASICRPSLRFACNTSCVV